MMKEEEGRLMKAMKDFCGVQATYGDEVSFVFGTVLSMSDS